MCRLLSGWVGVQLLQVVVRGSGIPHLVNEISIHYSVQSAAIWICLVIRHLTWRNKFHVSLDIILLDGFSLFSCISDRKKATHIA